MQSIAAYREEFIAYLNNRITSREPVNLYAPMEYIMGLGGKRLRPVLTLATTHIFKDDYRDALDAALAIELFHNFSLIHDDIMDDAPLRRGQQTVHEKWNINTGILSGDAMLIIAYQLFENYEPATFKRLATLFSSTAVEVCEGQQYDMDFENRDDVSIEEYLTMIKYKTAVLLGASLEMGGIIGEADAATCKRLYNFGINLGIAFQIMDDYLDAFGDQSAFGKQIGGDIIENKKTYLYLKTLEQLPEDQARELQHLYSITPPNPSAKINTVKELMISSGASQKTLEAIESYTREAISMLDELEIDREKKQILYDFAESLMKRTA